MKGAITMLRLETAPCVISCSVGVCAAAMKIVTSEPFRSTMILFLYRNIAVCEWYFGFILNTNLNQMNPLENTFKLAQRLFLVYSISPIFTQKFR